ncbi:hypothetical protein ACFWAP_00990 [Streptomyces goshikiensis]|uniref:hypothetical protein n=1 Tax=Streptomyces goshikiensis TaxID=1942 RepID=UPI00365B0E63
MPLGFLAGIVRADEVRGVVGHDMRPASPGQPTVFAHSAAARGVEPAPHRPVLDRPAVLRAGTTGATADDADRLAQPGPVQRHRDVPGGPMPYGSAIRANIVNDEV